MNLRALVALGISIVVVFAAAAAGSFFTSPSIPGWYASLRKPSFTPPNWLFGPAWTALYIMMAVAAWFVWRQGGLSAHKAAFVLFALQLVLNASWSPVFFGMHRTGAAMVILVFMWAAIFGTLVSFWRVTPWAGALLLPYQAWVTFAGVLNFSLWRLNK